MDLLSLLLAGALALGSAGATSSTTPTDSNDARGNIIEIGSPSSAETPPEDTSDARGNIIDIG
jgi:hypothetical protein